MIDDLKSLYALLLRVVDTYKARGKQHLFETLLALILVAKPGGEDKTIGISEWVANRAEELERLVSEYRQSQLETGPEIVFSIDGKILRGAVPAGEMQGSHLLSVYVPQQGWFWSKPNL